MSGTAADLLILYGAGLMAVGVLLITGVRSLWRGWMR